MVKKIIIGEPFETDAVVKNIPVSNIDELFPEKNSLSYGNISISYSDKKFEFHYKMKEETVIYGLGQAMGNINKRGRLYTSYCSDDPSHTENKESLYGAHNFILIHNHSASDSDVGFFFDYPGRISFDIGFSNIDDLKVYCGSKNIAIYVISYEKQCGENPLKNIVKQFREIIGQSYIPPRWAFGFMQSRWGYPTEKDVRNVYESYRKTGIPLDSICLDIDYMKDFKDFTVDCEKIPDLKGLSDELKADGVRLVPIIDAGVKIEKGYDVYEEGVKNNYFCKKADGSDFVAGVWPGRTHFPDFLQPEVRKWFGQKYKILTDMGIEGFWNDMNEPAIFYSDEGINDVLKKIKSFDTSNLDIMSFFAFKDIMGNLSNSQDDYNRFYHKVYHKVDSLPDTEGSSPAAWVPENNESSFIKHNDIHNLYGYNMTRSAGEELKKIRQGKRTLLFSRASYIGMHRYGGIWTGDNCSWWEHLALEIKMMPSLNMCGFLYSGADIGGFGCDTNRELLLRWLAFGVFTPLMRNHAALGTRNQECYRFENTDDFKDVISVRYRLLPYLYSEFMKAALTNDMYFRPLSFDYINDQRCFEIDDQLMVGNDIMVAPVCKSNAKGRMVYLPQDMILVRFMSGDKIQQENMAKGDHYIKVPLNEVVMFIKKGHVIPLAEPAINSDNIDYENLQLIGDIAGDAGDASGGNKNALSYELYKDDGYTTEYNIIKNLNILKSGSMI